MVARGTLWQSQGASGLFRPINASRKACSWPAGPCRALHTGQVLGSVLAVELARPAQQSHAAPHRLSASLDAELKGLGKLPMLQPQPQQPAETRPAAEQHPQRHYYAFRERLLCGMILRRRARFTLEVLVGNEVLLCYCPTTSMSLGGSRLDGEQVPCLLSRVDESVPRSARQQRQTAHTVEAISLDGCATWIGINQCTVVRYIGHFLRAGGMPEVCAAGEGLRAEQRVGSCRIDFVADGRDSIEVKMLPGRALRIENATSGVSAAPPGKAARNWRSFFQRIVAQLGCMTAELQAQRARRGLPQRSGERQRRLRELAGEGDAAADVPRAMLLLCYQHDEPRVRLPRQTHAQQSPLYVALKAAHAAGVEFWQINMRIDEAGVALTSYAPRNLFAGRPQSHVAALRGRDLLAETAASAACATGSSPAAAAPPSLSAAAEPAAGRELQAPLAAAAAAVGVKEGAGAELAALQALLAARSPPLLQQSALEDMQRGSAGPRGSARSGVGMPAEAALELAAAA